MPEDVFLRRAQERAHDGGRRKTLTGVGVGVGVALAAAAGIAVLGGALDHDGNDSDPHQVVSEGTVDATGPAIVSDVESTFYPAAQVVGTLKLRDDCLELASASGPSFPVWPPGTTWSADGAVVLGDGHTRYEVGDDVRAGGGYVPIDAALATVIGERAAERVQDCALGSRASSIALIAPPDS